MSDYIKRDDALNIDFKIIVRAFENRKTTAINAVQAYADAIAKIPSEDVRPVVRGKWEKADVQPYFRKHFDIFVCSNCHARGQTKWNFCPNCGADMREEG